MKKESFIQKYKEEVINPSISVIFINYVLVEEYYNKFYFVEGDTDIKFYSTLFDNNINDSFFIKCGGKTKVVNIYLYLRDHNEKIGENKIQYYIVDRDYDGVEKYNLIESDRITITNYYSFESYAFYKDNKKIILKTYGLNDDEIQNIIEQVKINFYDKIRTFETLVALSVNGIIHDVKLPTFSKESLFIDKENKTITLSNEFINKVNEIKNKVCKKKKKEFIQYYNKLKTYLDIRGHDLELYINEILELYHKSRDITDVLCDKEVLPILDINLELK